MQKNANILSAEEKLIWKIKQTSWCWWNFGFVLTRSISFCFSDLYHDGENAKDFIVDKLHSDTPLGLSNDDNSSSKYFAHIVNLLKTKKT